MLPFFFYDQYLELSFHFGFQGPMQTVHSELFFNSDTFLTGQENWLENKKAHKMLFLLLVTSNTVANFSWPRSCLTVLTLAEFPCLLIS